MKILNLYCKNIKSLAGEQQLDFTRPPLANASVFAITGPNGSGKSTLLDVISLALFGETYRFDKPAEHVMTKQTSDCFAQVDFSLAGCIYRAFWSTKRQGDQIDGEVLPAEMKLFRVKDDDVELLADNSQQVRQKIVELTGLDLHKFNQTMVLAQGEFAAFLNALDAERMDILEKIIGEDIYQKKKDEIRQKHRQIEQQVELLQQDLKAIPVLTEAEIEASEHDLDDFTAQQQEFHIQQKDIEQQLEKVQAVAQLEAQLQNLIQKKQALEKACEEQRQQLDKIESLHFAAAFKDELATYQQQLQAVEQTRQQIKHFQDEVEAIQKQLPDVDQQRLEQVADKDVAHQQQVIEEIRRQLATLKQTLPQETSLLQSVSTQLAEKKSALAFTQKWLQEHGQDQVLVESFPEIGQLKTIRAEINKLEDNLKKHGKWTKSTTVALKKQQAQIKEKKRTIKQLRQKLQETEQTIKDITQGKSFEELEALKLEQQERVDDFIELYDLAKVNAKLNKKGIFAFFAARKQEKLDIDEQALEEEVHLLELEIAKEENILGMLEKAVEYEALVKRLEKFRDKLEEGKPCPLCGSIQHPFVVQPPKLEDSKKALQDQRLKIKELKTRQVALNLQLKEAQKLQSEQVTKAGQLEQVISQWSVLANRLNIGSRVKIDNLASVKTELKKEKEQLAEINKLIRQCTKLHNQIEQIKSNIELNEKTLERLQQEYEELNTNWNNRPRELVEMEKLFDQRKTEEKALLQQLTEQLAQVGEKLPEPGEEDACFDRLNQRRMEYQTRVARLKVLTDEITGLEEKQAFCQEDVDSLNKQLNQYTQQLNQEESVGLQLAIVEKQKLLSTKEQQLQQQQAALQATQQQLASQLKDTSLRNIDELTEAIEQIGQQSSRQQQLQQQQQSLQQLEQQQRDLQAALEQQKSLLTEAQSIEELTQALQQVQEKADIVQQEIVTIKNKLNKQHTALEKRRAIEEKLGQQQLQLEQSQQQLALTKDEKGMEFRREVQQVLIDKMLSKSNQILEKISGRYYLRHQPSEQGFAMLIEDTRQNNSRRLPKTLSGGESFVVSLALALSLAESADQGHAIDSLFIDEGFGNLDKESLYLVMSTLENLKTQGKTVGVISHIDAVKKRVKTRIEMQKNKQGQSVFRVVG
jgi:exonuclease SbcC